MGQASGRAECEQSREFIESRINTIDESQKEKVTGGNWSGRPDFVVFNGAVDKYDLSHPMPIKVSELVRVFFVNAGPNLTSVISRCRGLVQPGLQERQPGQRGARGEHTGSAS